MGETRMRLRMEEGVKSAAISRMISGGREMKATGSSVVVHRVEAEGNGGGGDKSVDEEVSSV